jgi:hypothetical protein
MKLAPAAIGIFQLRGGQQASIHEIKDGKAIGLLLPVAAQGEPELGHSWKLNGEYSAAHDGVPHRLDLIQHTNDTPRRPEDFLTGTK